MQALCHSPRLRSMQKDFAIFGGNLAAKGYGRDTWIIPDNKFLSSRISLLFVPIVDATEVRDLGVASFGEHLFCFACATASLAIHDDRLGFVT